MNHIQAINRLERQLRDTAALFATRKTGARLSPHEVVALVNLEDAIANLDEGVDVTAVKLALLPNVAPVEDEYSHAEACEIRRQGGTLSCEED